MSTLINNTVGEGNGSKFDLIQNWIESVSGKMDKLINIQEKVLNRLDGMSHDIDGIEKDMENLKVDKEEIHFPPKMMNQTKVMGLEVREICQEMSTIMSAVNQRSEQQAQKLEGMEKLVLSMQQVISFIGEKVKSSKVMELMFKDPAAQKGSKTKDNKGKQTSKRKSSGDTVNKNLDKVRLRSIPKIKNLVHFQVLQPIHQYGHHVLFLLATFDFIDLVILGRTCENDHSSKAVHSVSSAAHECYLAWVLNSSYNGLG